MNLLKTVKAANVVPSIAAKMALIGGMDPKDAAVLAEVVFNCLEQCDVNDGASKEALVEYAAERITKLEIVNKRKVGVENAAERLVNSLVNSGYCEEGTYELTEAGKDKIFVKSACLPTTTPVSEEERRVSRVKGGAKPSALMLEAQKILENTAYCVDVQMLDIITKELMTDKGTFYTAIETNKFVVAGSDKMKKEKELYSEYFADERGRLYHAACAGPNPQSSDLARSLYSYAEADVVDMNTNPEAFEMFCEELKDISGIAEADLEKWCRGIVERPAAFLRKALEYKTRDEKGKFVTVEPTIKCKKPFTTVKMAFNYVSFLDTGKADVRVGIGEDAKCSGTQYLAFIAGDSNMARATGLDI